MKKNRVLLGQYTYLFPPPGVYIAELIPFKKEVPALPPPIEPKPPVTMELVTGVGDIIERIIGAAGTWPPWG